MEQSRLQDAVLWAAQLHAGQWREGDGPLPYVTHPIEVMSLLRFVGGVADEDLLCAAALHDAVESGDAKLSDVKNRFGERVSGIVKEVTREEPTNEFVVGMSKDEIWQLRSDILLNEIRAMSPDAQSLKLADRLSNVRGAFQTKRGKKLKRYLEQTELILSIVKRSINPGLWDAIQSAVRIGKG